jgi:hypothetical protein
LTGQAAIARTLSNADIVNKMTRQIAVGTFQHFDMPLTHIIDDGHLTGKIIGNACLLQEDFACVGLAEVYGIWADKRFLPMYLGYL